MSDKYPLLNLHITRVVTWSRVRTHRTDKNSLNLQHTLHIIMQNNTYLNITNEFYLYYCLYTYVKVQVCSDPMFFLRL